MVIQHTNKHYILLSTFCKLVQSKSLHNTANTKSRGKIFCLYFSFVVILG